MRSGSNDNPNFDINHQIDSLSEMAVRYLISQILIELSKISAQVPVEVFGVNNFWLQQETTAKLELQSQENLDRINQIKAMFGWTKEDELAINENADVSQLQEIEGVYWQLLKDKVPHLESIANFPQRWADFRRYLVPISSKGNLVLLMRDVCEYFNLIINDPQNKRLDQSLTEFPPSKEFLACEDGSKQRLEEAKRIFCTPENAAEFLDGYNFAIGSVVEQLRSDVPEGNHIHIKPFLEYSFGLLPKKYIKDSFFMSPSGSVDPAKVLKCSLEFVNELKKFWKEQCDDNEIFSVIANCAEQCKSALISDNNETYNTLYANIGSQLNKLGINENNIFTPDDDGQFVLDLVWLNKQREVVKTNRLNSFTELCRKYQVPTSSMQIDDATDQSNDHNQSGSEDGDVVMENAENKKSRSNNIKAEAENLVGHLESLDPSRQLRAINYLWLSSFLPKNDNNNSDNHLLFIRAIYDLGKNAEDKDIIQEATNKLGKIKNDPLLNLDEHQKSRVQDIIERLGTDKFKNLFAACYYQGLISKIPVGVGIDENGQLTANQEQNNQIFKAAIEADLNKAVVKLAGLKNADGTNIFDVNKMFYPSPFDDDEGEFYPPLHLAVIAKADNVVRALISIGADVNAQTTLNKNTPLIIAVVLGRTPDIVDALCKNCDIEWINVKASTAMLNAVHYGRLDLIDVLASNGSQIDGYNYEGSRIHYLVYAIEQGKFDSAKKILEINNKYNGNYLSETSKVLAAHQAIKSDNAADSLEVFESLLKIGVGFDLTIKKSTLLEIIVCSSNRSFLELAIKVNSSQDFHNKILSIACSGARYNKVKYLLNTLQFNLNSPDQFPKHPLIIAIESQKENKKINKLINIFLEKGVDPNQIFTIDNQHMFALEYAASLDKYEVVEHLIAKGADISCCFEEGTDQKLDGNGETQFNLKSSFKDNKNIAEFLENVKKFIKASYDGNLDVVVNALNNNPEIINAKDNDKTALLNACNQGKECVVRFLLGFGAEMECCFDKNGAVIAGVNEPISELLYSSYGLINDCVRGDFKGVKNLLNDKRFLFVNSKDKSLGSPLEIVCYIASDQYQQDEELILSIVKSLISKGANIFNCVKNNEINELVVNEPIRDLLIATKKFISAVVSNNLSEVSKILENGNDFLINSTNKEGKPVLHLAIESGSQEMVEFLLRKNPDIINAKDHLGNSALHCCVLSVNNKKYDIAKLLIERGINYDSKNEFGQTALDLCKNAMMSLLIEHSINEVESKKRSSENTDDEPAPKRQHADDKNQSPPSSPLRGSVVAVNRGQDPGKQPG